MTVTVEVAKPEGESSPVDLQLLSYSQRSGWLRCSNQYRLERAGYPQIPSMSLVAGGAFHSSCDDVDYTLWGGAEPGPDDIAAFWAKHLKERVDQELEVEPDVSRWKTYGRRTKEKPNKEDLAWWTENGAVMVEGYLQHRKVELAAGMDIAELPDGSPAIEVPLSFELPGDPPMRIRGSIDRVMEQDGVLLVRDLKTSQREPEDAGCQLGTYRVGWMLLFGTSIEWGDYFLARQRSSSNPIAVSHYTPELLANEYGFIARAKRDRIYPANPGQACATCGVIDACAIKGGSQAAAWASAMPR